MLQCANISLSLGNQAVLDDISIIINPADRIGLVGPNGAGKSTLLKVIMGLQEVDKGSVSTGKTESLGYLPQDGVEPNFSLNVVDEVESIFQPIFDLEKNVQHIQNKLGDIDPHSASYNDYLDQLGSLQTELEQSGIYSIRSKVEKVLTGLGFNSKDFSRTTSEFSGGWLMRMALAKLLLQDPTYLLLDEPTNHLDIESLQWLEQFLAQYEGAVIVVSHDQYFLDSLTNRTLAIRQGKLQDYAGNYSFYERKWDEERELLINTKRNQEKQIKDTQEFIDRFRYKATKARQVQSRVKQLQKLKHIEVESELDSVSFSFPTPERTGQIVVKLDQVVKRYKDLTVFDGIDLEIEREDKIAIVGPNGAGKSTLIRIMSGLEPIQSGIQILGHKVQHAYFAQHQADELDETEDPLGIMMRAGSGEKESRLRSILGSFLFTGDDVFKKVKVLSGGEKSRLALAKMLLSPANFLIFDEPTNHLDISSKAVLQQALQQYEGTCMIVSHDRSFLDPIVNKVLEIRPGSIRLFLGNVSYYLDKKKEEAELISSAHERNEESTKRDPSGTDNLSKKEKKRQEAERRNALSKRLRPLKKKINQLEAAIEDTENSLSSLEATMAEVDFYEDPIQVKETSIEYEKIKKELTKLMFQWEEYQERYEQIEAEFES
ncbi:MAG: ABC transporter ATP-binding protein [Balneola sp.]|nr:ABC transporter ATP-binding protein [Balneola sp.]